MVGLWIEVTDAEIGLRRAAKNEDTWKKTVCFSAVELQKNVTIGTSYEGARNVVFDTTRRISQVQPVRQVGHHTNFE